jgi:hypothetical protein
VRPGLNAVLARSDLGKKSRSANSHGRSAL